MVPLEYALMSRGEEAVVYHYVHAQVDARYHRLLRVLLELNLC